MMPLYGRGYFEANPFTVPSGNVEASMRYFSFFLALTLLGCEPIPPGDTQPPRLVETVVSDKGGELSLVFDEPLAEAKAGGDFTPEAEATVDGGRVRVVLPADLKPGKGYRWTAEVQDAEHNLTSVTGRFYGPNDHPAGLRLNEVRIAGSGTHTDFVELAVVKAGSLGGWTIDVFSGPEARQRMVLPDKAVSAGDCWINPSSFSEAVVLIVNAPDLEVMERLWSPNLTFAPFHFQVARLRKERDQCHSRQC